MKIVFLHFFDLSSHSGVSKKILSQIDALRECGAEVKLCYMKIDESGNHKRVCDDTIIDDFGNGFLAKLLKWFKFRNLTNFILSNKTDLLYIRSIYNTTPSLLKMLSKLHSSGVKIVMEFPTYPYDKETRGIPISSWIIIIFNRLFRKNLKTYIDRAVTFSDADYIHGIKTIKISNGIDFNQIKLKEKGKTNNEILNLIGVAEIKFWHGFDRIINGIANYEKEGGNYDIHFHIVGDGPKKSMCFLKEITKNNKLEDKIHFYGNKSGKDLDELFEISDFGIASLGRHRSGITKIKALKNREYAARGIPFIYSEIDEDFENMPYILKASPDESIINISELVVFYQSLKMTPEEIRNSISDTLTWKVQMKKVIDETYNT